MKTVLVVDDTVEIRENVAEMLELANYNVITAQNGREGCDLARTQLPDLVVSDIMMPVVDGFEMLRMLRSDAKTSSIPFIFLTAKSERTESQNALAAGADGFITKPFSNDELIEAVEVILTKREKAASQKSK